MNTSIQIFVSNEALKIQPACHCSPVSCRCRAIMSSSSNAPAAASAPSVLTVMPSAAPLTIG